MVQCFVKVIQLDKACRTLITLLSDTFNKELFIRDVKAYRSLMIARIPPIHVFIVNAAGI